MHYFEKEVNLLLINEKVKEMQNFIQHKNITTLEHCIGVAFYSYKIAKFLNIKLHKHLNERAIVRGAILHDLFLYDWHIRGRFAKDSHNIFKMHGFTHPLESLKNANKYLNISVLESDIIENHMFPLTITHKPKSVESFIVSIIDKYCAIREYLGIQYKFKLENMRVFI